MDLSSTMAHSESCFSREPVGDENLDLCFALGVFRGICLPSVIPALESGATLAQIKLPWQVFPFLYAELRKLAESRGKDRPK
jgi:hypothetical protein